MCERQGDRAADQSRGGKLLGGRPGTDFGQTGDLGREDAIDRFIEDGQRPCQRPGAWGGTGEQSTRETAGPELAQRRHVLAREIETRLLRRLRKLADVERISAGGRVAGGDELLVGLTGALPGQEPSGCPPRQRSGTEDLRSWLGQKPHEQSRFAVGVRLAASDDQPRRYAIDPDGEVVQEPQRCLVSPLRIVESEQARIGGAQVEGEPEHPVEDLRRGGQLGVRRSRRPCHRPGQAGRPVEQELPLLGPGGHQDRLKPLPGDAEWNVAL